MRPIDLAGAAAIAQDASICCTQLGAMLALIGDATEQQGRVSNAISGCASMALMIAEKLDTIDALMPPKAAGGTT